MKAEFLNTEIWILTFGGGFQRANIYKGKNISPEVRKEFRNALKNHIEYIVESQYHEPVKEEAHIKNIYSIVNFSKTEKFEGTNIPINFGVAQKLLNLYLKYLWCSEKLNTIPVHFPVDRLVQEHLNEAAQKIGLPKIKIKAWTQFQNEEYYLEVIRFAERVKEKSTKFQDAQLAEMELEMFNRR